jgi:hypothetical protein
MCLHFHKYHVGYVYWTGLRNIILRSYFCLLCRRTQAKHVTSCPQQSRALRIDIRCELEKKVRTFASRKTYTVPVAHLETRRHTTPLPMLDRLLSYWNLCARHPLLRTPFEIGKSTRAMVETLRRGTRPDCPQI